MIVFQWLNNQLLKMVWLYDLVELFVNKAFKLDINTKLGGSIHFFIYDVIKIFILLSVLIFTISYIQSFFPPERTRKILGRFDGITANILGALLGTVTPFCSCSSIPLFIGFTSAGLPIGVTFSFLISSPLVDLASVLLLASIFNWRIAIAYVVVGLVIAVAGGTVIEKLGMERYIADFVRQAANGTELDTPELTVSDRLSYASDQVVQTFRKVFLYILVGVGIGALIHNWIPADWIEGAFGKGNPFGVLLVTVIGIPMYGDIFGTIPIAEALLYKGADLGTVLSFMMAVTTLSLPSMIMLSKVVQAPLLRTFVAVCTIGIILVGYLFNLLQGWFI